MHSLRRKLAGEKRRAEMAEEEAQEEKRHREELQRAAERVEHVIEGLRRERDEYVAKTVRHAIVSS